MLFLSLIVNKQDYILDYHIIYYYVTSCIMLHLVRFLGHDFFVLCFTYTNYFIWHKIYLSCTSYMQDIDTGNANKKNQCLFPRSSQSNEDRQVENSNLTDRYQATQSGGRKRPGAEKTGA